MIQINQLKAEEITKERIRAYRDPLLVEQDILFQREMEKPAAQQNTAAIVAEKQRLRDLPDTATGKTIEELKQIHIDLGL